MATVEGLVRSAVSTDRRQYPARSPRAPQASALPQLSGAAPEQCHHCEPGYDRHRSCSSSQAPERYPPHIDRSSSAPKAQPSAATSTISVQSPPSHTSFSSKIRRCCVDRLNPPHKADIGQTMRESPARVRNRHPEEGARAIANLKPARAVYHSPPCEYRHWRRGR